jgi:hypothetical protein
VAAVAERGKTDPEAPPRSDSPKSDTDGSLDREIVGRPGVAVPKTKQQIEVRGPRTCAGQPGECHVRRVGLDLREAPPKIGL